MISISRIRMRNFKSFKAADIEFPQTYICFAGPNGSGKSNVTDSIRFCLGETSLRSLRAKRVRDLIHHGASTAEVTLIFDGDEKYEIKRAIRQDGKILYKLNGKKTTRFAILDALKKYNLDESGRNIIAQGEVQRIVGMTGRERRTIIDSVAGISTFESKKKEATRELEVVETRIKDANLVLGERLAFLGELEKEKAAALVYVERKKDLTNAKATMIKREIERLDKELAELKETEGKIQTELTTKESEVAELSATVEKIEQKRLGVSSQLQQKQQTASLVRKIEELKASVASKEQLITDKQELVEKLRKEKTGVELSIEAEKGALLQLEKEMEKIRHEIKVAEEELGRNKTDVKATKAQKVAGELEDARKILNEVREAIIKLESEIQAKTEIIAAKKNELQAIKVGDEGDEDVSGQGQKGELEKRLKALNDGIADCFARTKEINGEIAVIDRKLLEYKEEASMLRVRVSPMLANPALKFIADLQEKEDGIYGIVADLIKCDSKYSSALEAAGGARLLYVVVENAEVASGIITRLKRAGAGRATFIPLREIKTSVVRPQNGLQPIIDVIKSDRAVQKAVEYVFGDTYLVDTMTQAKKVGVGKERMVTLDGEIFERSGIMSGGKLQSNILAATQLKKLDDTLLELKGQKDALVRELFSIREEESQKRQEKSEVEIEIKTIEMRTKQQEEEEKEAHALLLRRAELERSIDELTGKRQALMQERSGRQSDAEAAQKKVDELRNHLLEVEKAEQKLSDEEQEKRTRQAAHLSSLEATLDGMAKEIGLRKNSITEKEQKQNARARDEREEAQKIVDLKKQVLADGHALREAEEKIAHHSKEIEKLFEEMKRHETELQKMGKEIGERRIVIDKYTKEKMQLEVKKATNETRLQDYRAEFSQYQSFEELERTKDELMQIIRESEQKIAELGNINMAAIELYDKKYAEIGDIKEKIEKLAEERTAVLAMINEIEERKKEAFFETFYAVSDNFRKMFAHISIGEGFLYLDAPNDPFESGLHIKLKRGGKEHTLDSLSGGENSLVALMFIFALQFFKPAPFYILDEVDAALDKENSKNLSKLIHNMARDTQFMVVSHNDTVMSSAEVVIGVTKVEGISKIVGVNLESIGQRAV